MDNLVTQCQPAPGWTVSLIPNKFPALSTAGEKSRRGAGYFVTLNGVGFHEVLIESHRHDLTTALLPDAVVTAGLGIFRQRFREWKEDSRLEAAVAFKNHGSSAGSSIEHPHCQLAATPVVPSQVRSRVEVAARHFDDEGSCVFCDALAEELADGRRIVEATQHFVAFIPFAAFSPFHLWIFPRRHASGFEHASDEELKDLGGLLRRTLARLYHGLANPPFNYSIRGIPFGLGETRYFHWYVTIVPRVSKMAGFEIGTGMFINSSSPEASADFLRQVQPPPPLPATSG